MYLIKPLFERCVRERGVVMELPNQRMVIKTEPGIIRLLNSDSIVAIKAAGNYVEIHLEQETLLSRLTLKAFISRLTDSFVQTHRSYVINLKHLKEIRSEMDRYSDCCMTNGDVIPLSGRYRSNILALLGLGDDALSVSYPKLDGD